MVEVTYCKGCGKVLPEHVHEHCDARCKTIDELQIIKSSAGITCTPQEIMRIIAMKKNGDRPEQIALDLKLPFDSVKKVTRNRLLQEKFNFKNRMKGFPKRPNYDPSRSPEESEEIILREYKKTHSYLKTAANLKMSYTYVNQVIAANTKKLNESYNQAIKDQIDTHQKNIFPSTPIYKPGIFTRIINKIAKIRLPRVKIYYR